MIDLIINDDGGVVLVHDQPELDAYGVLAVSVTSGRCRLEGEKAVPLDLPALVPSMREMLREDMEARMVRMDGWSIAGSRGIKLDLTLSET